MTTLARLLRRATAGALAAPVLAGVASAHAAHPTHGPGTDWLLALLGAGVAVLAATGLLHRSRWADRPRRSALGLLLGVALATVGAAGLVETQIEPLGDAPQLQGVYPALAVGTGVASMVASLVGSLGRWADRPAYPVLGTLLGLWIAYPQLLPGRGYFHPLGYLLVPAVAATVAYVLLTEVRPGLAGLDRRAQAFGAAATVVFGLFYAVSAGLLTFSPEVTPSMEGSFAVVTEFVNPLVMWPAVEFFYAPVPVFGALSVGTALVGATLVALVGANAALGFAVWQRAAEAPPSEGAVGALATTGATACCCCGPALYGVASGVLGAGASPLYWAFLDPASPLGTIFLAAALALLTGSAVELAGSCRVAGGHRS